MARTSVTGASGERTGAAVAGNLIAQAGPPLIGLLTVPILLNLLGADAYGVIGLYASAQALVATLDLGLTTTMTLAVTRVAEGSAEGAGRSRALLRGSEAFFLATGAVLVVLGVLLSDGVGRWLAERSGLSSGTLRISALLITAAVAARLPANLYTGVLRGLHATKIVAAVAVGAAAARAVVGIAAVAATDGSIVAFLAAQLVLSAMEVLLLASAARRRLPASQGREWTVRRAFDRAVRVQAAWLALMTVAGVGLKQADRIALTSLMTLEDVAYYTVALSVSAGFLMIPQALGAALLPRMATAFAGADEHVPVDLFHRASRTLAFYFVPLAGLVLLLSEQVLEAWTQASDVAAAAAPVLRLLMLGTILNGMMYVPHVTQLTARMTWLPAANTVVSAIVLLPATWFLVSHHGIRGAGFAWVAFNVWYILVIPLVMHRSVLRSQWSRWFVGAVAVPLAGGLALALAASRVLVGPNRLLSGVALVVVGYGYLMVAARLGVVPLRQLGSGLVPRLRRTATVTGAPPSPA